MWMFPIIVLLGVSLSRDRYLNPYRDREWRGVSDRETQAAIRQIKRRIVCREVRDTYGPTPEECTCAETLQELVGEGLVREVKYPAHTTWNGVARTHYELTGIGHDLLRPTWWIPELY